MVGTSSAFSLHGHLAALQSYRISLFYGAVLAGVLPWADSVVGESWIEDEDVLESCCIVDCQVCFAACTLPGKDPQQVTDQISDLASAMMMRLRAICPVKSRLSKTVLQTIDPYSNPMADGSALG